jgi:hypothetical protein
MRCALAHAQQAPLHPLQRRGCQGDQDEQQPICRRRQATVLVHAKPTCGSGCPIEPPRRQVGLKRGLTGRAPLLTLVEGQAGHLQERRGADLHVGEPYTGHAWCLLLLETPYTINRDKLMRLYPL